MEKPSEIPLSDELNALALTIASFEIRAARGPLSDDGRKRFGQVLDEVIRTFDNRKAFQSLTPVQQRLYDKCMGLKERVFTAPGEGADQGFSGEQVATSNSAVEGAVLETATQASEAVSSSESIVEEGDQGTDEVLTAEERAGLGKRLAQEIVNTMDFSGEAPGKFKGWDSLISDFDLLWTRRDGQLNQVYYILEQMLESVEPGNQRISKAKSSVRLVRAMKDLAYNLDNLPRMDAGELSVDDSRFSLILDIIREELGNRVFGNEARPESLKRLMENLVEKVRGMRKRTKISFLSELANKLEDSVDCLSDRPDSAGEASASDRS